MKPHQLLAALMAAEDLGPLPLAKKIGQPGLQSQIHRFRAGEVRQPTMATAAPLAAYFRIPVEALYHEKAAAQVARERGITVLPETPVRRVPRAADPDAEALRIAARYARMDEAARRRFNLLLRAAEESVPPGEQVLDPAGHISSPSNDGASSNWGTLADIDGAPKKRRDSK